MNGLLGGKPPHFTFHDVQAEGPFKDRGRPIVYFGRAGDCETLRRLYPEVRIAERRDPFGRVLYVKARSEQP